MPQRGREACIAIAVPIPLATGHGYGPAPVLPRIFTNPRLAFLAVAAASAWLCLSLPLFSQEAYYWTYAQHPDLSYFDHPPLVAWLIWLGTHVLGDGTAGVRLGTWACGLGCTAAGAQLLRAFGVDAAGRCLWMLLSLASPLLAMVHFLATPDPPLVCCWTLTMLALWRARDGGWRWWLLAGTTAGLALVAKYSGAFLAVGGLVLLLFDARMRAQLRRPAPYVAVLVAAAVFSPVVIWNANRGFESFRFQTEGRFVKGTLGTRWLFEFVSEQFGIVHPVLAVGCVGAVLWLARRCHRDPRALWLLAFGLPLPLYMLTQSLWIQVKINWLAPAVVPLTLGVVLWWREHLVARLRPGTARALGWTLALVPLALPLAPALRLLEQGRGTTWTGWQELAATAEELAAGLAAGKPASDVFFFAADYRDAAQLGYHRTLLRQGDGSGAAAARVDGPTLAKNVLGMPALQFDHWTRPQSLVGKDAIFVLPRPGERDEMVAAATARFARIERARHVVITRLGIQVLDADIYLCHDYRGPNNGG